MSTISNLATLTMSNTTFNQNLPRLENIFGKVNITNRTKRLREIFDNTETSWQNNLNRFNNKKVQFILIAEAAPWSDEGIPRYFYNQIEVDIIKNLASIFPIFINSK